PSSTSSASAAVSATVSAATVSPTEVSPTDVSPGDVSAVVVSVGSSSSSEQPGMVTLATSANEDNARMRRTDAHVARMGSSFQGDSQPLSHVRYLQGHRPHFILCRLPRQSHGGPSVGAAFGVEA